MIHLGLAIILKAYVFLFCDTPMTISLQGSWGSGKTSMMNMIKNKIGDRIIPVWFNTWQYSQFNMGETLSISMLSSLILELKKQCKDDEKSAKGKSFFDKIIQLPFKVPVAEYNISSYVKGLLKMDISSEDKTI